MSRTCKAQAGSTHVEVIDDGYAAMLRGQPGWRRVDALDDFLAFATEMAEASIRRQYPSWRDEQVLEEVTRRVGCAAY